MTAPPLTDSDEYDEIWDLIVEMEPNVPIDVADKVKVIDRALRYLPLFTTIDAYDETANSAANLKHRIIVADLVISRATMNIKNSDITRVRIYNEEIEKSATSSSMFDLYSKQFQRDVYAFGFALRLNPPWIPYITDEWEYSDFDGDYRSLPDGF